jgi:hypothetical protein
VRRIATRSPTSFEDGDPVEPIEEYDTDRIVTGGEP